MNEFLEDLVDVKPLAGVTAYAGGAGMQGIAFGLLVGHFKQSEWAAFLLPAAGLLFIVGSVFSLRAFSMLKRKYRTTRIDQTE